MAIILILHCRRNRDAEELLYDLLSLRQAVLFDDLDGEVAGFFQEGDVADDVAGTEAHGAGLAGAEELAGAAEFEIEIGEVEAVERFRELREAILFFVGDE